ncbi:leucine-rich repeat domain-containing protein [Listeria welshimeri]|nr:leucine-rich repeat domain-containing protein [Listeria welshimeri]MBC2360558.1 leucine-rich repeat domain-containing protein [Listeria welshimeri]
MKHTIDDLKQVWMEAGYKTKPYTKEQIDIALKKYTIPKLLIEYYEIIGEIEDECDHEFHVFSPNELSYISDGDGNPVELLMFASEMQGVCEYGFNTKDISSENPIVYCGGDPYEEIAKTTEYFFIPGTHTEINIEDNIDSRFLMQTLWSFAKCQIDTDWVFEDDNLYGYSNEELTIIKEAEKKVASAWEQQKYLLAILRGEEEEKENADFSLIKSFDFHCAYSTDEHRPIPTACNYLDVFKKVENVEILDIRGAIIEDSEIFSNMQKVKELYLIDCKIKERNSLANLPKLKKLYLNHSIIEDFTSLENITTLKLLSAEYIGLKDLVILKNMKKLVEINLGGNGVEDITPIKNLFKLKDLILSNNNIKDLTAFNDLVNFNYLELKGNNITDISSLKNCINMQALYLDFNPIEDISIIVNMKNLERLSLSNTKISDISLLTEYDKLKYLNVNNTLLSENSI